MSRMHTFCLLLIATVVMTSDGANSQGRPSINNPESPPAPSSAPRPTALPEASVPTGGNPESPWPGSPTTGSAQSGACAQTNEFGLRRFERSKGLVAQCDGIASVADKRLSSGVSATSAAAGYYEDGDERPRAIYGLDDRIEAEQLRRELTHPKLSAVGKAVKATAALIESPKVTRNGRGHRLDLQTYTADRGRPLCQGEKFAQQKIAAYCTVFLVAPNIVATAGHCIDWPDVNEDDPARNRFTVVFGFETRDGVERQDFRADEVYQIKRVIERMKDGRQDDLQDFALVELDREVPRQIAEPLRLGGSLGLKVDAGTPLGVIGHPSGLAKKVSFAKRSSTEGGNRAMEAGSGSIFRAQLNTFHVNSGSPVMFYDEPDVVAGILVQGQPDFAEQYDSRGTACLRHMIYQTDQMCPLGNKFERCAEKVTKIGLIERFLPE